MLELYSKTKRYFKIKMCEYFRVPALTDKEWEKVTILT